MLYDIEELLKGKDTKLYDRLQEIKDITKHHLDKIQEVFPEYTPHTISHKYTVISNLSYLIPKELSNRMNEYEIFFLLCATYIHDIGMSKLKELGDKEDLNNFDKEKIRKLHHYRIKEYLEKYPDKFKLNEQEATYVGKIALGHRKVDLKNNKEFRHYDTFDNCEINVPLLAAFLRLADELDITYKRIPSFLYKHDPPKDKFSLQEWQKHWSIHGLAFNQNEKIIKSTSKCKSPEIHRKLQIVKEVINAQLEDLPNYLYQYSEFKSLLYHRFNLTIENIGYNYPNIKMTFDPKTIMNLLMGNKIYPEKDYAIREVLKNSIDACRSKKAICRQKGLEYQPTIWINYENYTLKITDNGIGMDEKFIENFFTKVGQSYYQSAEFKEKNLNFTPLGELGIGILSCFMISDKIEINTKTDTSKPLYIEIENVSDFLFVKELDNAECLSGTSVTLNLKDFSVNPNITNIVKKYLRDIEFPIHVNNKPINTKLKKPDINYIGKHDERNNSIDLFHIKLDDKSVRGYISILKEKHNNIFLPIYDSNIIYGKNKFYLSNNGILIQDEIDTSYKSIIPPWLNRQLICGEINFLKHNLTFSLSRDTIFYNEECVGIRNIIGNYINKGIENLYRKYDKRVIHSFFETYIFRSHLHMLSSKRNLISDDYDIELPFDNSILISLIKSLYPFYCFCKKEFQLLSYGKLKSNENSLVIVNHSISEYNFNRKYMLEHIINNYKFKEDSIYIICYSSGLYQILNNLFSDLESFEFDAKIKREYPKELNKLIDNNEWKVVSLNNINDKRFMQILSIEQNKNDLKSGYYLHGFFAINKNNEFTKLILEKKEDIIKKNKFSFQNFMRYLDENFFNSKNIIKEQKKFLKELVKTKIINEKEVKKYYLKTSDLPY